MNRERYTSGVSAVVSRIVRTGRANVIGITHGGYGFHWEAFLVASRNKCLRRRPHPVLDRVVCPRRRRA